MMKLIIVLKAMIKIRESSMTPWQGFCYNTFSIGSDSNCNIINNNLNMISFYRTGENKMQNKKMKNETNFFFFKFVPGFDLI